ncbi:MAG: DUF4382 domain-containing protein, partial [Terriglobia bacterium]
MARRLLSWSLILGLVALSLTGCGGTPSVPAPSDGTLTIVVGDTPLCDVLSFRTLVTALSVTRENGGTVSVIPANSSIWVDYAALSDTSTILAQAATLGSGTYTQGTLTVAAPTMSIFDPTVSPPVDVVTPTFTTETINFNINPPLVVTEGQVSVLKVDFNLPESVESTQQGQLNVTGTPGALTVKVTPVVTGTPLVASGNQGFGNMDDVYGYVLSVSSTYASAKFTGSFVLQLLSGLSTVTPGGGPSVTVNLTKNTQLIGTPALNQLTTESFAAVDGYLDTDGDFVAKSATIENREDIDSNVTAFLGPILSITKDSSGNVTQLTMSVRDEEPNTGASDGGNPVDLDTPPVIVNIPASTGFYFASPATNFANNTPDSSYLAVGEQVVVHGSYVPPPTVTAPATPPPVTMTAEDIYIPLQTVPGNFISLISAGSDSVTGGFLFTPCPQIFRGQPIYVFTSGGLNPVTNLPETQFLNVNGLSGLTAPPQLFVRGLLFYDLNGSVINGVSVPSGSYVLLAET